MRPTPVRLLVPLCTMCFSRAPRSSGGLSLAFPVADGLFARRVRGFRSDRRFLNSFACAATANVRHLDKVTWERRKLDFEARLAPVLEGRDRDHPIFNFLWKYYGLKPRQLSRWSPGPFVFLEGFSPFAVDDSGPSYKQGWNAIDDGGYYDCRRSSHDRVMRLAWVRDVLWQTSRRPPLLNCYGLHEWAMLYRPKGQGSSIVSQHQELPLRVSQELLNSVVEERPLRCTHTDAVRFFAAPALPFLASFDQQSVEEATGESVEELEKKYSSKEFAEAVLNHGNVPNRALQPTFEQPGCVHATMDLFKWATKLAPFIDSELIVDCLDLAITARTLDMRASPYDLRVAAEQLGNNWGPFDSSPIAIETEEGQQQYGGLQLELYVSAAPVRSRVISAYDEFLDCWPELRGLKRQPGKK